MAKSTRRNRCARTSTQSRCSRTVAIRGAKAVEECPPAPAAQKETILPGKVGHSLGSKRLSAGPKLSHFSLSR